MCCSTVKKQVKFVPRFEYLDEVIDALSKWVRTSNSTEWHILVVVVSCWGTVTGPVGRRSRAQCPNNIVRPAVPLDYSKNNKFGHDSLGGNLHELLGIYDRVYRVP